MSIAFRYVTLMQAQRAHSKIIADAADLVGSEVRLAAAIGGGVKPYNVGDWRRRDSIPAQHWPRFVDLGFSNYKELAAHVAAPASSRAA